MPGGKRTPDQPPARGEAIARLVGAQHGVVARRQLLRLGLDHAAIRRRVAAGVLNPLHGGWVYSLGRNPLSASGNWLAAVMACGSRAALSHRSAGALWQLRPYGGDPDVTVPQVCRVVPGVSIHRTRMLDPRDFTLADGIPVTGVARTLLDLGAVVRPTDLEVAVDRAERLGLFDLTALIDVLGRANGRKGARALRKVVSAYRPSTQKSELERRFRALLETATDVPTPFFNALVEGETATHEVDAHWRTHRLAVQVDGFEFHRTRRDREKDAAADADLELAGHRVMRFTWDDVTANGPRTLRRLRLALGLP